MEPVWAALGQATGVIASLAVDRREAPAEVPVALVQDKLLTEKSLLIFYKDVALEDPAFAAIQRLSLIGAMAGDRTCLFEPAQPITFGDLARLLVVGLAVPISITAAHFQDVPRGADAFRYIETIWDASSRSDSPFFPFLVRDYANWWSWLAPNLQDAPAFAHPQAAVTSDVAARMASGLLKRVVAPPTPSGNFLTRRDAAGWLDELRQRTGTQH
jgi:hypothetical protein